MIESYISKNILFRNLHTINRLLLRRLAEKQSEALLELKTVQIIHKYSDLLRVT